VLGNGLADQGNRPVREADCIWRISLRTPVFSGAPRIANLVFAGVTPVMLLQLKMRLRHAAALARR